MVQQTSWNQFLNNSKDRYLCSIVEQYTLFITSIQIMNSTIILILTVFAVFTTSTILDDISTLRTSLYRTYWNQNMTFKFPGTFDHLQGLFQSDIHFNVVDKKNSFKSASVRQKFKIDDENMFVTSFVLYGLLEAEQLGTLQIDHHLFSRSLQTLASFRDKNQKFGVPQYMFWPQQQINGTWSSKSVNLFDLIDKMPNLPKKLQDYLSNHGFSLWIYAKEMKSQFVIPADADDSSVNIALLGYLHELQSEHYNFWQQCNFNLEQFYQSILRYAYRPFNPSNTTRANEIDPRTYFILHDFLKAKKAEAESKGLEPNVILPTTWMLTREETIIDIVRMPFDLNNVDASVNANFLFALIFQMKSGFQPSGELRHVIRDITDLLVYVVNDAVERRPDLILMYYPSKSDFYWFVARIISLLERIERTDPELEYVYSQLSVVMRGEATERILKEKLEAKEGSYWVQFLGNYAGKNRTEDSIYSTALVLNALLDTWGVKSNKSFKLLENTPQAVKEAITKGSAFLLAKIKSKNSKLNNAFFSGSLKILFKDYPTIFPANKITDKDNNPIDAQKSTFNDLSKVTEDCMKGFIEDAEYQRMLKLKWFQADVPITFEGYNDGNGVLFPFWSSPSITQVMMITALSKYYHISKQQTITEN